MTKTQLKNYLCWSEHEDRADGTVICETDPGAAANEYLSNLLVRESVGELESVIIFVDPGKGHAPQKFKIGVRLEPVCYLDEVKNG
jgi:hypothetical protein